MVTVNLPGIMGSNGAGCTPSPAHSPSKDLVFRVAGFSNSLNKTGREGERTAIFYTLNWKHLTKNIPVFFLFLFLS